MGHSTYVTNVRTNGVTTDLRSIMLQAYDSFRDEENGDARGGRPYLLQSNPVSSDEAYSKVESLELRDGSPVPVMPYTSDVATKVKKVTRTVTREQYKQIMRYSSWPGSNYSGFFKDSEQFVSRAVVVDLPKVRTAKASNTEGKLMTRYFLTHPGGETVKDSNRKILKFDSIAEAKVRALDILNNPKNARFSTLNVEAVVERENSSHLAVIERPIPDEVKVVFEVTYTTPKPHAKVEGYIVAFDFHH